MLIEFRVKNFATLKDRTILSAEAATRLRKFKKSNVFYHQNPQLLKNLLILGPNGSGKTSLLNVLLLRTYDTILSYLMLLVKIKIPNLVYEFLFKIKSMIIVLNTTVRLLIMKS